MRGAAHAIGAEMRPVDRDAFPDRPTEQRAHRHAIRLAGDIQQRVLDRRDRLLVQPAARLPRQHVQMLRDLLEAPRVAPDQHRRQPVDHVRQAGTAKTLVELRPADDAVVGGDLQEREHPPAGIGLHRLDLGDLHGFLPRSRAALCLRYQTPPNPSTAHPARQEGPRD